MNRLATCLAAAATVASAAALGANPCPGTTSGPFVRNDAGNPFASLSFRCSGTTYNMLKPAFADIDGDGDYDAFFGTAEGPVIYAPNSGSTTNPVFASVLCTTGDPLSGYVTATGGNSSPTFGDLDGDADLDVLVGDALGKISYYKNTGSRTSPVFAQQTGAANPFNSFNSGSTLTYTQPVIVDLDNDSRLDVVVGAQDGHFYYFHNTGQVETPAFTMANSGNSPFNSLVAPAGQPNQRNSVPAFTRLFGTGLSDLLSGDANGTFVCFKNTGSATAPAFAAAACPAPLDTYCQSNCNSNNKNTAPTTVDINGDGAQDIFSGDAASVSPVYFSNLGGITSGLGAFNAVDTGLGINGAIGTKIAGSPFLVDLLALNQTCNGLSTNFNGTVSVTLYDGHDSSGGFVQDSNGNTNCRSSWAVLQSLGNADFSNQENGRHPLTITYNNASRSTRIRIDYVQGGNQGTLTACSTDAFAIRPDRFVAQATDADAQTAGTSRTLNATTASGAGSTPTHKAGRPFTVRLTALNAVGATTTTYDGQPTLSAAAGLGNAIGALGIGSWVPGAGVVRDDGITYGEAGTFGLGATDSSFAAVDASDGSSLGQRQISTTSSLTVGRFTPDHLAVTTNTPRFTPGCTAFTYVGQPFGFATAPAATVTAVAFTGNTTTNYAGGLAKLSPTSVAVNPYTVNSPQSLVATGLPSPRVSVGTVTSGVGVVTFDGSGNLAVTRGAPAVPFNVEIALSASVVDDDLIAYSGNPVTFGATTAGNGIAFGADQTFKQMRFGELLLLNAYGSELLPLDVPMRVMQFAALAAGGNAFVSAGAADASCTTGSSLGTITLGETNLGNGSTGQTSVTSHAIVTGLGSIVLAAPAGGARGRVTVTPQLMSSYSWLQTDSDGNGSYTEDPSASASFGLFEGNDRRIYTREQVR